MFPTMRPPYKQTHWKVIKVGKKSHLKTQVSKTIKKNSKRCLVGGFSPFEKSSPSRCENIKYLKPPPRCRFLGGPMVERVVKTTKKKGENRRQNVGNVFQPQASGVENSPKR